MELLVIFLPIFAYLLGVILFARYWRSHFNWDLAIRCTARYDGCGHGNNKPHDLFVGEMGATAISVGAGLVWPVLWVLPIVKAKNPTLHERKFIAKQQKALADKKIEDQRDRIKQLEREAGIA